MHGPTEKEVTFLKSWARDLKAFIHNEQEYEFGTKEIDDYKVATSEAGLEVRKDERWKELLHLAEIFNGE